jgi:DNA-binding protein H-NS
MWPLIAPALVQGGFNLFSGLFGNRSQNRMNQQSLAQQLQMFREQQAFLQQQAEQDRLRWEAQQAEDTRRYNDMMGMQKEQWEAQQGMQKEQWEAQQQLRAPYRAASRNLLDGAFGGGAINRYPGTLGNLLQRG